MVFGYQIYRQKKSLLSKILLNVTALMHKVRRLSLFAAIESAINT